MKICNLEKELSIVKFNDGKYHLIGPIYEKELHELSLVGWDEYHEALEVLEKFNYKLWRNKR